MHSVFLVPSIFAVLFEHSRRSWKDKSYLAKFTWLLDVIATLLAGAAVALPIVVASASVNNVSDQHFLLVSLLFFRILTSNSSHALVHISLLSYLY
jgi:hypothetical protein